LGWRHALKARSGQRLARVLNAGVPAHIGANHDGSSDRDSGQDEYEQRRRTERERQTAAPSDANRRGLERGGAALNGGKSILQVKIGVHRELPFSCSCWHGGKCRMLIIYNTDPTQIHARCANHIWPRTDPGSIIPPSGAAR
jgi:hypothetical protein